jgi:trans-aconitate methyltransferase
MEMMEFHRSVPSVARIYNALLGGKDNYESDRVAAARILEIEPGAAVAARQNRAFLRRVVQSLTDEMSVRQFLDIGSGLPTADNVHDVAQSIALESRIAYVDNDRVVISHARALLVSSLEGECCYVDSDLRDTESIITQAAESLDFNRPVAVLLFAILHFVPDKDDPWEIVRRLMAAVPPGSYLAVSHATPEHFTDSANKEMLSKVYAETASGGVTPRPRPQVERFFDGLEMIDPGVVDISAWRPAARPAVPAADDHSSRTLFYGGVARKP